MKVISSNPIYLNKEQMYNDIYMNLDAKSSVNEIKDFQAFAISKGYDLSYINKYGKKVNGVDGVFGKKTAYAWSKIGSDWEKAKGMTSGSTTTTATTSTTSTPSATISTTSSSPTGSSTSTTSTSSSTPTSSKIADEDKNKKLRNILIIAGAGLIVFGIFIFLARKRTNITNKKIYIRKRYFRKK